MTKSLNREQVHLSFEDTFQGMKQLPDASFDLAIADPPYGASTHATWNLKDHHTLKGFGGPWKLASHTWDMFSGIEGFETTLCWLSELQRLVKPTGSIWIHATYHNAGIINVACQILGLEIINEIAWFKRNAFPNLSTRRLTASHETLFWVHTGGKNRQYRFNYEDVKAATFPEDTIKQPGKQLRTVWDIPNNKSREERKFGTHPTQKPLRITRRMFLIAAIRGGKLLVPFAGSGTEIIAGLDYGMKCVGFENDQEYFDLASLRITEYLENKQKEFQLNLFSKVVT